jgi:hypothetical protein
MHSKGRLDSALQGIFTEMWITPLAEINHRFYFSAM